MTLSLYLSGKIGPAKFWLLISFEDNQFFVLFQNHSTKRHAKTRQVMKKHGIPRQFRGIPGGLHSVEHLCILCSAVNFGIKKYRESKTSSRDRFLISREFNFPLKIFLKFPIPEIHFPGNRLREPGIPEIF